MSLTRILKWFVISLLCIALIMIAISYFVAKQFSGDLPEINSLRNVKYQVPLSIYSRDGELIAQFGEKKRIPVNIEDVPQELIYAFLAAEDSRFFDHPGVDYQGLLRASLQLLLTGEKKQGGSTITMQVVRNFLLTREKTYKRKIKEIILALQIEQEFTKDEILDLYLNKIYLGHRAYGVSAAAQVYYGKQLNELSLAESAMIAGLPKAPSIYNPITNSERALQRRNYVLQRMLKLGYIHQEEFSLANSQPTTSKLDKQSQELLPALYIAEMVRNDLFAQYGEEIYALGLKVYTTIDKQLQIAANLALTSALHDYDQRHGYRKKDKLSNSTFADVQQMKSIGDIFPAYVDKVESKSVVAKLKDETEIEITWPNIKWARAFKTRNVIGPTLKSAHDILKSGDIIFVRKLEDGAWGLSQIPEVEGALVALNPVNGAILALSGGFDFHQSKYNRVIQSKRQPGSGFKPIIYTTALENGFTAASIINDAPVVVDDPSQESEWRPENYSHKFYGPTRLRTALRKSRNLISIRLLRELGINNVIATAQRFGFSKQQLPESLTLALGSGYANPLQMARVFAVFANGGFLINPYYIDRIETNSGEILFQETPDLACSSCTGGKQLKTGNAPRIISPETNFLMNSLLRDVVQRGTATRAKKLDRNDLAGKTGTTNDQRDAWFNGFAPTIVATAWVGFDNSEPLGRGETGGKAALPMWINFMREALKQLPAEKPLIAPKGISKAYIDPETGLLAAPGSNTGIWEYFIKGSIPSNTIENLENFESTQEEQPIEALF